MRWQIYAPLASSPGKLFLTILSRKSLPRRALLSPNAERLGGAACGEREQRPRVPGGARGVEPAAGDGRRPHAARGPLRACRAAVALHLRRQQLRPAHGPARHACPRPRQYELGGGRHLRRQRRHVLCPAQGRAHRLRLLGLGDVRLRRLPRRVHEYGVGVRLGAALLAADHPGGRAAARPAGRHPHPPGRPLRALRWRDRHRPARRRRTLSPRA